MLNQAKFRPHGLHFAADGKPEYESAIRWIYEPGSFTPIARYEKGLLHYAVTDTVGRVQELLTEDGLIVWKGKQQLWGREEGINKDDAPTCRLRFPGQYEDAESGLYYNHFRHYDCGTGQYLCADPIGLKGGLNLYQYAPNPLSWIDPLGLSCRTDNLGRTPGKNSRTGREVIARMRSNGDVIDVNGQTIFKASDGNWYPLREADMSHITDAVTWWNKTGRFLGPKLPAVRQWMLDSKNYYLDHYSLNRSAGAQLGQIYLPPVASIPPIVK